MNTEHPRFSQTGRPEPPDGRPPVAPERITVLKASYKQTWLYFLLLLCLVVAWAFPLRILILRMVAYRPVPRGTRDAHAFVAVAYENLSENKRHVSPKQFREHLAALKDAGYKPVSLDEVRALYRDNKPLPRKAILMTFDQSRKSAYFDARIPLRRAGWNGVVFLWTKPLTEEDPGSLRWQYARTMLLSGAWEIGAQSHDGFARIPGDGEGTLRNFMSSPRWIAGETRYENPTEFSQRLAQDHETALSIIQTNLQVRPFAYAFPYGDFGQFDQRAALSRRLNLDLVGRYYDLGFIIGQTALNTRQSDPRRLSRLLVDPAWTGEDLVARLDHAWPRQEGYANDAVFATPATWIPDWGDFHLTAGGARFAAAEETTGAKAWLSGSDLLQDFHTRFRVRIRSGHFGLFLRATPDGEEHVYLSLSDDGKAWLRQKHAGMTPFTLASARFGTDNDEIEVDVFARDQLLSIMLDGRPLFSEIVYARGQARCGMIGFSVWHPDAGKAEAELTALDLKPSRPSAVTWPVEASPRRDLTYWLGHNAYRYSHMVAPWLHADTQGAFEQYGWDASLFASLASIYRMRFVPEIRFESFEALTLLPPDIIAQRAQDLQADGLLLNLSALQRGLVVSQLTAWLQRTGRHLAEQGRDMLVRLPPLLEQASTMPGLLATIPNAQMVVTDPHADGETVLRQDTAAIPYPDLDLTLYYELSGLFEPDETWSSEMHAEWLRQEGRSAFQAGNFQKARDVWSHWSRLDPLNAEPVSLVGDVYLREGDTETALAYYKQSLDINPGQIGLMVRMARLLDVTQKDPEAAMELLNQYAHVFPWHPDISLAQAQWLKRRSRRAEAEGLIGRVLEQHPDNLRARTMLHGLLSDPAKRRANLREIVRTGSRPGLEMQLASAIREYELFTLPDSWLLMDVIERMAAKASPASQREPFQALLPRETPAHEDFQSMRLSPEWISSIEYDPETPGSMLLGADMLKTEAYLRLDRSDAMHNGYIEATLDEPRGFLWLYARRGAGSMVRFGFDQSGRMYLQAWRRGQIVAQERRFWEHPDRPIHLRLEIRGDGAKGYIDGEPAFAAPLAIPKDMGLGWWGVAPWAPQYGMAQVIIREIEGGPLPVGIGWFQRRDRPLADEEMVDLLRPRIEGLSAIVPSWYRHELDGSISHETEEAYSHLRIFARYHRVRLLPAIRSVVWRNLDLPVLKEMAARDRVDGFTLLVPRMPPEEWFERVEDALVGTSLTLLIAHIDEQNQTATLRETASFVGLFPGARRTRTLPLVAAAEAEDAALEEQEFLAGKEDEVLLF